MIPKVIHLSCFIAPPPERRSTGLDSFSAGRKRNVTGKFKRSLPDQDRQAAAARFEVAILLAAKPEPRIRFVTFRPAANSNCDTLSRNPPGPTFRPLVQPLY